jgi:hypothetical protein
MSRARARATVVVSLSLALAACSSSRATPIPGDAGGDAASDARADVGDGAVDAIVYDGAGSHAPCAFNRECPSDERCVCDETTGCECQFGPRGTGKNGVDACAGGNDCESSVCLEGPGGAYVCSGECASNADCGGKLPLCTDVALVGKICVRSP